jgi:putative SOS response-associated peptidase YedK
MCGKFTQRMGWSRLAELAELIAASDGPVETVTPMRFASVIRLNATGRRETARMRWGLVPHWETDASSGTKFLHARAETIETKRTFREAFLARRGIAAVTGFNEGEEITPRKTRQHTITPRDGKPLGIAVVWERWGEGRDTALLSFAMVTVPANRLLSTITDRMPAVVAYDDWAKWLGEAPATVDELKAMLQPMEGDWEMKPQDRKPPPPKPKGERQESLF